MSNMQKAFNRLWLGLGGLAKILVFGALLAALLGLVIGVPVKVFITVFRWVTA